MAVTLKARISLIDKLTAPMRKIDRQLGKTSKTMSHMDRNTRGMGRSLGSLTRSLNPVALGFAGIAAGATAAYGAVKVFNSTVGEAMKLQQSQIVIGAMFDDKKLSKDYMKMIDKFSIKSPLMDSQTMYGNSKSFITQSKDINQLEKMWGLTERLMASDPQQGLEGAIFALRELFSGDAISIVDRFELPRKVMNDIKKLPLDEQLTALDKYFNKIGLTTELIDDMGGSALGMWSQVKERFQLVMRDMGEPSLKAVSKFLGGLIDRLEGQDMKKFGKWGGKVIESMVNGLSNNAIRLYDWFTALASSEEFKSKTTFFSKVDFIVGDITNRLNAWLDGGGRDSLITFASSVTETIMGVLNNSKGFAEVGYTLGSSLINGFISGLEKTAKESTFGQLALATFNGTLPGQVNAGINYGKTFFDNSSDKTKNELGRNYTPHSAGLDKVPYSGYKASLHVGEKVLPAQEAREYREGGGKGGVVVNVSTLNVRKESDIKKVAYELARLIEEGGLPHHV